MTIAAVSLKPAAVIAEASLRLLREPLNVSRARQTNPVVSDWRGGRAAMKFAVLVAVGMILGTLGGAAVGIGIGIIWSEIVHADTPAASGTLVFFTFMPIGAVLGAFAGAVLFGVIAARDSEIQIEREPAHPGEG